MSSKKFLSTLFIFYIISLLSYPSPVFAQTESCSFSNSEIEGVEVGQIGDRKIYTLFTQHLFGQHDEAAAIITSHTPENAVAPLNQLLEKHLATIVSEQSDVQKIIELAESEKIDWIGIEHNRTDTSYVDIESDIYSKYLPYINALLNPLPDWDSSKTNQLFSLMYSALIIAHANHPETFQGIRMHLLGDESLKKETNERIDDFNHWETLVRQDTHVTPYQYSEIVSLTGKTVIPNPRLILESEFEDLLDNLRVEEGSRTNMRRLIRAHNDIISLIPRRDKAVVQSILDLPGNGLILFGTSHGPGIKQGLITACQNENSSP